MVRLLSLSRSALGGCGFKLALGGLKRGYGFRLDNETSFSLQIYFRWPWFQIDFGWPETWPWFQINMAVGFILSIELWVLDRVSSCGFLMAMGSWGCGWPWVSLDMAAIGLRFDGFCLLWPSSVLGLMSFARHSILHLPLSPVRIEISRIDFWISRAMVQPRCGSSN